MPPLSLKLIHEIEIKLINSASSQARSRSKSKSRDIKRRRLQSGSTTKTGVVAEASGAEFGNAKVEVVMDCTTSGWKKRLRMWLATEIVGGGFDTGAAILGMSTVFEKAFRLMYGLPEGIAAFPPMPGGEDWSTLHCWVMPTPSFLEIHHVCKIVFRLARRLESEEQCF